MKIQLNTCTTGQCNYNNVTICFIMAIIVEETVKSTISCEKQKNAL